MARPPLDPSATSPAPSEPAPGGPVANLGPQAPLWAVLAFTFVNSLASGVTFNGMPFITEQTYRFTPTTICLLALMQGLTYIVGAVGAGPGLRWIGRRFPRLTPRVMLAVLMATAFALAVIPVAVWRLGDPTDRLAGSWAIWVYLGLYSALTGVLWPIVESFLAGGRSAAALRGATGTFNIVWSSALVGSMWLVGGFQGEQKLDAVLIAGLVHLASAALLLWLPTRPGEHEHEVHRHPPIYRPLLTVHRVLLPVSYLVMYAMQPLLPGAARSVGIEDQWAPQLVSAWLAARVLTFAVMQRWHGWHGLWGTAVLGPVMLLTGFGLVVLRLADPGPLAVALFVIGLVLFGFGAATVYAAALYYAMEVGAAEVDAGGTHEAMIGVGYSVGPLCSLVPLLVASGSGSPANGAGGGTGTATVAITVAVAGAGCVLAFAMRNRHAGGRYPDPETDRPRTPVMGEGRPPDANVG